MQQIGRYQVSEEIGRGAISVVYSAINPAIRRTVAIKSVCLDEIGEVGRISDRLARELEKAGTLSHRNIVPVYDLIEQDNYVHIVMELVNGPSLARTMFTGRVPDKPLILAYFRQIASALDYAHANGVVHRDLKPGNILLENFSTAGEPLAKITDFGIANLVSQALAKSGAKVIGAHYLAPEQIQGAELTGKTDQFALAVIAYELLTGQKPFTGDFPPTLFFRIAREEAPAAHVVNPSLNIDVTTTLWKALAKNPAQRFESCTAFTAALARALSTVPEWILYPQPEPSSRPVLEPFETRQMRRPAGPVADVPEEVTRIWAPSAFVSPPAEPKPETQPPLPVREEAPVASRPGAAPPMSPWFSASPVSGAASSNLSSPNTPPVIGPQAEDLSSRSHAAAPFTQPPLHNVHEQGVREQNVDHSVPSFAMPPLPRRRARNREDQDDDEDSAEGLPLWRKIAIALLVCLMVAIAFLLYRNFAPSAPTQTAAQQPQAEQPVPAPTSPAPLDSGSAGSDAAPLAGQGQSPKPSPAPGGTNTAAASKPRGETIPGRTLPDTRPSTTRPDLPLEAGAPPATAKHREMSARPVPVQFATVPQNARVVVDHDELLSCQAPCSLPLTAGRHTLEVKADGYSLAQRIIQVPEDTSVVVALARNIGTVQVSSNPTGASIYIDGKLLGQTPATLHLAEGPHQIRLARGSFNHQETINVVSGNVQEFSFKWSE